MKLPGKSTAQEVDIKDFYAVKPGSIWRGLKQENAVLWWLCAYLFFEYVRPQTIYPVIDVLPWTQITLLFACFSAFSDREVKGVSNPANILFGLFYFIVFLSSILAFNPSIAFEKISIPIVWIIVYFLMVTSINTEKKFFVFALLFLVVNFKMSQHGFVTYAQRGFGYASWGLAGSPGWFQNAGDFGIQMVIFSSLSAAFVLALRENWGKYKRLFFYLFPFTAVVSVIGSASRGAQLGLAAMGLWFLLKTKGGLKATLGILIVGWLLVSILPEEMLAEYDSAGDDDTSEHRLMMWDYGMEVVGDKPLLGVGFENWVPYCWFMNPGGIGGWPCLEVHSSYVEALTEIGILGFIFFLLNMLYILVLNAKTRAMAKQLENRFIWFTAHGLDGGLVGAMVASTFFSILFYPMFWIQLALTVTLHEVAKKQHKEKIGVPKRPRM